MSKPNENKKNEVNFSGRPKLAKNISAWIATRFVLSNLFFDRVIVYMTFIGFGISFIFAIITAAMMRTHVHYKANVVSVFNYFFIVLFFLLYFIMIIRMSQYFLITKNDDKTIYIVVANQMSRTKLLLTIIAVSCGYIWSTAIINAFIYSFGSSIFSGIFDGFVFKLGLYFAAYIIPYSMFLFIFLLFLLLYLSKNLVTILSSFILSFNFISNLPDQFLNSNLKSQFLPFGSLVEPVNDVTNYFNFERAVNSGQMLYPNLAKYLNKSFIDGQFDEISFDNDIPSRIKIWGDKLLIDNDKEINVEFDNVPLESVNYANDGQGWGGSINRWNRGFYVNAHFHLIDRFIKPEQLDELIKDPSTSSDNKKILTEFRGAMKDLIRNFGGLDNLFHYYLTTTDDFNDYTILDTRKFTFVPTADGKPATGWPKPGGKIDYDNVSVNYVTNGPQKLSNKEMDDTNLAIFNLRPTDIASLLRNAIKTDDETMSQFGLSSDQQSEQASFTAGDENSTYFPDKIETMEDLITELENPVQLAATILDRGFVHFTDYYRTLTTTSISEGVDSTGKDPWKTYKKTGKTYKTIFYFNVFANSLTNFTSWINSAYDEYWFQPKTTSVVNFNAFQNAMLPYTWYRLKLINSDDGSIMIDPKTYNNYVPPYVYLIVNFLVMLGLLGASIIIFYRKDLKG